MTNSLSQQGLFSSRWLFILAATGAAVGLGNIWKFPYMAGENGGGAFVLVYLVCIFLVGIPIMTAEVLLGRAGRKNPVDTMYNLAAASEARPVWGWVGIMGVVAGLLIMSFYSVIAGWALHYFSEALQGAFIQQDAAAISAQFDQLLQSPMTLFAWHSLFTFMTALIVMLGVSAGLGSVAKYMMPFLLLVLLVLVSYALFAGHFAEAAKFLFRPDFSKLTASSVLAAMGHAFFTLSIGMGAIMAYGAYMPASACVGRTIFAVAILDTLVALLAGLAIFPLVFAYGLAPSSGPGLLFVSLPIAFGQMPAGAVFGALFFAFVIIAAWSSSVSMIEPAVAWLTERFGFRRWQATLVIALACWLLGIASVLSFNLWAEVKPVYLMGRNPFDFLDMLTSQVMLPLGGAAMGIFVGWKMAGRLRQTELASLSPMLQKALLFLLCWVSPILVATVMMAKLYESFGA